MIQTEEFEWEIKSKTPYLNLKLKDTWDYRDLLWLLIRRDFVSVYKQTILGPLWFIIQPLITTITFTFIFGKLAGISTDGVPQPLFYMAGIIAWNYFSDCINKTSTVFRDNEYIFGKVYFPRLIMPISIVFSNLIRFGIQFFLFMLMIVYYAFNGYMFHFTWALALFPLLILLIASLGLGAGLTISAMTTKYRDLVFLLTFGIQLLMYSTTVIYPLSAAPEKFTWIIELNPMTPIIELFRFGFFGEGSFSLGSISYAALITFALLTGGLIVFNKVEKNFVDTV